MTTLCAVCPRAVSFQQAVNQVGVEIQEFHLPLGWQARPEHQFATCCQAVAALNAIASDGIERRLYPSLHL